MLRHTGPGRARDKHVRHLLEIGDIWPAVQVFAQRQRQFSLRLLELRSLEDVTQVHDLGLRVGNLDTDGAAAGNRRDDADALRLHRERQIRFKVRDLIHFHTCRRNDLELRDHRASRSLAERALHVERPQLLDQHAAKLVQPPIHAVVVPSIGLREQIHRRDLVFDFPLGVGVCEIQAAFGLVGFAFVLPLDGFFPLARVLLQLALDLISLVPVGLVFVGLVWRLHPFRFESGHRLRLRRGPLCRCLRPRFGELLALVREHSSGTTRCFTPRHHTPADRAQGVPAKRPDRERDDAGAEEQQRADDPDEIDQRASERRAEPPGGALRPIQQHPRRNGTEEEQTSRKHGEPRRPVLRDPTADAETTKAQKRRHDERRRAEERLQEGADRGSERPHDVARGEPLSSAPADDRHGEQRQEDEKREGQEPYRENLLFLLPSQHVGVIKLPTR